LSEKPQRLRLWFAGLREASGYRIQPGVYRPALGAFLVGFCGSSAIIDPRGVVIAAASADREQLIHADLSEELVLSVRKRVESFAHRRQDLYG
jgi:predicted amidohydrolase